MSACFFRGGCVTCGFAAICLDFEHRGTSEMVKKLIVSNLQQFWQLLIPPQIISPAKDEVERTFVQDTLLEECRNIFVFVGIIVSVSLIISLVVETAFYTHRPYYAHLSIFVPLLLACSTFGSVGLAVVPQVYERAIGFSLAMIVIIGSLAGSLLGAMGDMNTPLFYGIYIMPTFVLFVPCKLPIRLLATVLVLLGFSSMFLLQQAHIHFPQVNVTAMYLGASTFTSLALGHRNWRLLQERALVRYRLELDRQQTHNQNTQLAYTLRQQTRRATALQREVGEVRDEERLNIARDLHDDIGQILVGAKMEMEFLDTKLERNEKLDAQQLDRLYDVMFNLEGNIRTMIRDLREARAPDDLKASIDRIIAEHNTRRQISFSVDEHLLDRLSNEQKSLIYRVIQEGLTNIAKHSDATRCWISLIDTEEGLAMLNIEDNGSAFDDAQPTSGWGLRGVNERAVSLGGSSSLGRIDDHTVLSVQLPL